MVSLGDPHYAGSLFQEFKVDDDDKKQMTYPASKLNIIWGNDKRYWTSPTNDKEPAELIQVCWLEVCGSVVKTRPDKTYEVGFKISLAPDAFGWAQSPVYLMAKRGKNGKFKWKKLFIGADGNKEGEITVTSEVVKKDDDQASSTNTTDDSKLYFGLYEIWSGRWKGGLKIDYAFIREFP